LDFIHPTPVGYSRPTSFQTGGICVDRASRLHMRCHPYRDPGQR
jgi:hypothetical protein